MSTNQNSKEKFSGKVVQLINLLVKKNKERRKEGLLFLPRYLQNISILKKNFVIML